MTLRSARLRLENYNRHFVENDGKEIDDELERNSS